MSQKRGYLVLLGVFALVACGQTPAMEPTASAVSTSAPPPSAVAAPAPTPEGTARAATTPAGTRFAVRDYQGIPLVSSLTFDHPNAPPSAWLIVGNQAIEATLGSHGTVDVAPTDEFMKTVATAAIPPGSSPVLVIGAGPLDQVSVGIRPWQGGSPDRRHGSHPDGTAPTALLLDPLPTDADQFLHVFVRFGYPNGSDASYLWHLTVGNDSPTVVP